MPRHLRDDLRRRAETVDAETLCVPRLHEGAIANQPGAEQRRSLRIGVGIRKAKTEPRVGHGVFGVTAIQCVAGELRVVAEVLALGTAKTALPSCPAQPRDADALARLETRDTFAQRRHAPDDFMPRHQRQLGLRQRAINNVQIRPAHGARADLHQHLAYARRRYRQFSQPEPLPRLTENHRTHSLVERAASAPARQMRQRLSCPHGFHLPLAAILADVAGLQEVRVSRRPLAGEFVAVRTELVLGFR